MAAAGKSVREGSDRELASEAAAGSAAALEALLGRHYDRIYRMAWRLIGNRSDAEDIAQDVCVKVALSIRSWRGDAELTTWLWRITWNAATDTLRARQRIRPLDPSDMQSLVETGSAPGASLSADAVATGTTVDDEPPADGQALWQAVRALPAQQRNAVLLVYGEEMSHAEAAAVLGCAEKTVSWHLHAARKRLKSMLEAVA